jgi:Flp pilus assembly pilin Flp
MKAALARLRRDDDGQDLIEYALLASLISILSIAGLLFLGTYIQVGWRVLRNVIGEQL